METEHQIQKNLINKFSIGIAVIDKEGRIIFVNQKIREITGYTAREVKNMNDWFENAFPDPEYRKKAKKYYQYDLEHNITDRTYKITTAAGKHKYLNFRHSKLEAGKLLFEIIDISEKIKEKRELRDRKIFFENLFINSLEAIAILDKDLKIIDVNNKFKQMFEVSKQEVLNKFALEAVKIIEDPEDIVEEMKLVLEGKEWENQVRFLVNNQIKYSNVHIFSVENKKHHKLTYIIIDDITELKKQEKELKEIKERLELAVTGANIGIWDWDIKKGYIHYNENWAQMLGYELADLNNDLNTWLDLVHPDDKAKALENIKEHLQAKTEKYLYEHRLKTKLGEWKWIRDIGKVTERDEDGNALRVVGVHVDIDKEKRTAKEIEYLSNHDELTGLYNRRYFNEEIKRLHNSRRYPISIIVGDLNKLKDINDSYGHIMGDKYIKLTAEIIKESLRAEDLAARIGGDEFSVILPETDKKTVKNITERILNNIESKSEKIDLPEPLSIALGCETAVLNDQKNNSQKIIDCFNKADQKMYEHKFANDFAVKQ